MTMRPPRSDNMITFCSNDLPVGNRARAPARTRSTPCCRVRAKPGACNTRNETAAEEKQTARDWTRGARGAQPMGGGSRLNRAQILESSAWASAQPMDWTRAWPRALTDRRRQRAGGSSKLKMMRQCQTAHALHARGSLRSTMEVASHAWSTPARPNQIRPWVGRASGSATDRPARARRCWASVGPNMTSRSLRRPWVGRAARCAPWRDIETAE